MDPHSSSFHNELGGEGENMVAYLFNSLQDLNPNTIVSQLDNSVAFDNLFLAPPFDPSQSSPPYPPPDHSVDESIVPQLFSQYYDLIFPPRVTSPTNPQPPAVAPSNVSAPEYDPENDVVELQRSLDDAIAFIHARQSESQSSYYRSNLC